MNTKSNDSNSRRSFVKSNEPRSQLVSADTIAYENNCSCLLPITAQDNMQSPSDCEPVATTNSSDKQNDWRDHNVAVEENLLSLSKATHSVDVSTVFSMATEQAENTTAAFVEATAAFTEAINSAKLAIQTAESGEYSITSQFDDKATMAAASATHALNHALSMASTISATLAAINTVRMFATSSVLAKADQHTNGKDAMPTPMLVINDMATASSYNHNDDCHSENVLSKQSEGPQLELSGPINEMHIKASTQCITIDESSTRAQVQLLNRRNAQLNSSISTTTTTKPDIRFLSLPYIKICSNLSAEQKCLRMEFAVEQIYRQLFDLLWNTVPTRYRRKGFPTQPPLFEWNKANVKRYVSNLRFIDDSVLDWQQWYDRYFNIDRFHHCAPSKYAYYTDYLRWKSYLIQDEEEFYQRMMDRFKKIELIPPIYSRTHFWPRSKGVFRSLLLIYNG
ncbi:hypothetical protein BDF19DRAFT_438464 [Syncephalis fuscata]|nr:hypothetical protein BDF19DRAFT_438464 [Syncephalis fuscata]